MYLIIRAVKEHELDTWDSFLQNHPSGTLYHTSAWRSAVNKSYGSGSYTIVSVWQDDEIKAGMSGLMRTRLGVNTAVTPLATPYTGFLFDQGEDPHAVNLNLLKYARQFRYMHLQCAPGISNHQSIADAGYTIIPRKTLEINLGLNESELWDSFEGNTRRNIRKAQKSGFVINDQWDSAAMYQILCETFERNGTACPINFNWFREMSDGTMLSDFRKRYVAWKDDKPHSFLVAFRYKDHVYYQLAGTATAARNSGISSCLIWEMLREHLGGPWKVFDFVGGNSPGITRFKEGFNPTIRPHVIVERSISLRLGLARTVRDFLRRKL